MSDRIIHGTDVGRWELRRLPESTWSTTDAPLAGVVVHRTDAGALAAVQVDLDASGSIPGEARALVIDLTGVDPTAPPAEAAVPATPGRLESSDGGFEFAVGVDGAVGVDPERRGRWSFDHDRLMATISVPVTDPARAGDLWVSVVDMRSGDVLAAGALAPAGSSDPSAALTMALPFSADEVRVEVGRADREPVGAARPGWGLWAALAGVLALVVATVVAGVSVWDAPAFDAAVDWVAAAEVGAMTLEMLVAVLLVERLWRFPLLRPLVGFVVAASVFAYSNVLYSMLNMGGGWGTWYAEAAEVLQWSVIFVLPATAGWAFSGLVVRSRRR